MQYFFSLSLSNYIQNYIKKNLNIATTKQHWLNQWCEFGAGHSICLAEEFLKMLKKYVFKHVSYLQLQN